MDFFDSFPAMERQDLRDLKKGIDSSFRDFSRAYGDEIEGFFEPLLHFLVWLEKLLVNAPWPVVIIGLAILAWLGSRSWKLVTGTVIAFLRYWLFWDVEGYNGNPRYNIGCHITVYCGWYSLWNMDG